MKMNIVSSEGLKTSMIKRASAAILYISLLGAFSSCEKVVGEGPVVTETRNVDGFRKIGISISGKVTYRIDPVYKVEVTAQQNILDILQTNKVGDELVIKIQDGKRIRNHEDIVVMVSAPYLTGVNLSGSAEFNQVNNVAANSLDLRVSGSGNITIFQAELSDKLSATVSGSGNITVQSGSAKNSEVTVSGSGSINTGNLAVERADAGISGSGNIQVYATQTLDASISGSGSVYYRGTPLITTHISGSGRVKPF